MLSFTEEQQELIDNIKRKVWARVEEFWLDMMENPTDDSAFYEHISGVIARNGGAQRLPDLWELPLSFFAEKGRFDLVLNLAKPALKYVPDAPALHPVVLQAFREIHKDCPRLEYYIRASHLRDKFHIGECLEHCEEFLFFDEGEYFQHVNWGVGHVVELDVTQLKVTVDFPRARHKTFTFEGAHQYLKKIPQNNFLALQESKLETLREMMEKNPTDLIKLILRSYNNAINLTDLKSLLTEKVITEDAFSSWWGRLKSSLRNDPWIELGSGNRSDIRLRGEAMGYFDEMLERFEKAHTLAEKRKIIRELAQHQKGQPLPMEKAAAFAARVRQWHSACDPDNLAKRLNMAYLMEETSALMPTPPAPLEDSVDGILEKAPQLVSFLGSLDIFDYACRALERFLTLHPEESVTFLQNLYLDAPSPLGQYAFEKLLERKEFQAASDAAHKLLEHFDRSPETYAWTVRQILKRKWPDVDLMLSDFTLMDDALNQLERVRQKYVTGSYDARENRRLQSLLRAIFTEDKFANIASVIPRLSPAEAKRFHNSILTSPAFISSVKDNIDNVFRKIRKDIFEEENVDNAPKMHYCIAENLKEKQDELRRIKTVDIPRATKEIEVARGHGDLTENAEYDAAREHQAFLFQQMETLQDLLARTRIIDPHNVQTAQISIGTRFTLKNTDTGNFETHTLLGMWEASPDSGILSYLSPLGQGLLGKKVGETLELELPGGNRARFEVISIENAFKK